MFLKNNTQAEFEKAEAKKILGLPLTPHEKILLNYWKTFQIWMHLKKF